MTRNNLLLLTITGLLPGCATETSSGAGPSLVVLVADFETASGEPLPRVVAVPEVWPEPDSSLIYGEVAIETGGQHPIDLGRFDGGVIDSLRLTAYPSVCSGFDTARIARRALRLHGRADTIRVGRLSLSRIHPRALLTEGPACADAIEEGDPFRYFQLALWFDDISDSVRGRWRKSYQASYGDEYGYFSGVRSGDFLLLGLNLVNPWSTCTKYTLTMPIAAPDTLAQAALTSSGCRYHSDRLRFTEGEFLSPLLPPL